MRSQPVALKDWPSSRSMDLLIVSSAAIRYEIPLLTHFCAQFSIAPDYPDIELVIGAGGVSGDLSGTMRNMIGMTEQFYQKVYKGIRGRVCVYTLTLYNSNSDSINYCFFKACIWHGACFVASK